ncbi:MAG: hypothetical protein R2822_16760 [Spirosomataceae bacterium]
MILPKKWFLWVEVLNRMKKEQNTRTAKPKTKKSRPQKQIVTFVDEFKSEIAAFFEINEPRAFGLSQLYEHFDAGRF